MDLPIPSHGGKARRRSFPRAARALAALALFAAPLSAQEFDEDVGAWFAFAGTGPLERGDDGGRWRWWLDVHARFLDDSDGFEQSILRPGLGYQLSERATLWAGYGWIRTDPATGDDFDEHRIWQQLTFGAPLGGSSFFSRSRLEQRFVDTGDDTGWRFRQFLRLTRPLAESGPLGLRVWDELFFDLNDTDWGADTGLRQNRLFAGFGWTFEDARHLTLEFGYLNQYLRRSSGDDGMNHILAVTLLANL